MTILNSIRNHGYINISNFKFNISISQSLANEAVRENLSFPVLLTVIFSDNIRSKVTLILLLKKLKQQ